MFWFYVALLLAVVVSLLLELCPKCGSLNTYTSRDRRLHCYKCGHDDADEAALRYWRQLP